MFESQSSNIMGENTGPDSPKMFCSRILWWTLLAKKCYLYLYSIFSLQLASTHSFHSNGLGGIEDWKWHTGESFLIDWSVMYMQKHHSILHIDLYQTEFVWHVTLCKTNPSCKRKRKRKKFISIFVVYFECRLFLNGFLHLQWPSEKQFYCRSLFLKKKKNIFLNNYLQFIEF